MIRISYNLNCKAAVGPNNLSNYHLIPVLSMLTKILKILVYNRLNTLCLKHNVIYNKQYGFLPKFHTTFAVNDASDIVIKSINSKN